MVTNKTLIFNEVPKGKVVPGQTLKQSSEEIDLDAKPKNGEILTKTLALSLDPYLRGRMRAPGKESYVPEFPLHEPLSNGGVSVILSSSNPSFKKGQHIYGNHSFKEYNIFSLEETKKLKVLPEDSGIPWSTWTGAAGMPGMTAWWGLKNIGKPKKGETIFISGASGAVGQIVGQLAKAQGLRVIGSAGSDDKVEFIKKELNFDVGFNYKKINTAEALKNEKLDIYWDNVGGETLDAALEAMNVYGRVVACGTIATYNGEVHPIKNYTLVVGKQLDYQGFIILHRDTTGFYDEIPALIKEGKLTPKEHLTKGFDNGEAFLAMMEGGNFGKATIVFDE